MTIPAPTTDVQKQRADFSRCSRAARNVESGRASDSIHLSMGMSDDMDSAIAEGATIIRVGTAIFGPREKGKPVKILGD